MSVLDSVLRAVAALALLAFAVGLFGMSTGDTALAEAGEAVFGAAFVAAWMLALRKMWKERKGGRPSKGRPR